MGGNSALVSSKGSPRFEVGLRSRGESENARGGGGERKEGEAAFPRGQEHAKGIVTGRKECLEATARERDRGERVV